jgi:hypothetical protein
MSTIDAYRVQCGAAGDQAVRERISMDAGVGVGLNRSDAGGSRTGSTGSAWHPERDDEELFLLATPFYLARNAFRDCRQLTRWLLGRH